MKLNELLDGVALAARHVQDVECSGICCDTREMTPGCLFVALPGYKTDGHRYIRQALERGAAAVLCQRPPEGEGPWLVTEDTRAALAIASANWFGHPARELTLLAVTGTNGKTTTATLLYRLFRSLGYKVGLISTVTYCIDSERRESTHTTPDSVRLNRMMAEMVDRGCEYCFMEVSSHSLVQHRTEGLHFAGAVFTNITHDHLDYHHTFAEYIRAKKMLFDALGKEAFALTNADDRNGAVMVQNTKAPVRTYGLRTMADFRCRVVEMLLDGMQLDLDGREVWVKFLGRFNAYNLTAVYATALLLGADRDEVLRILSELTSVSGRFEYVRSADGVTAIVDYAHTPDALQNVLRTIDEIRREGQRIYVVVGCGGNRDKTKRPEMAQIAVANSDLAILTSDNPRMEDPETILEDMKAGLDPSASYLAVTNRREAIRTAVTLARPGDIILLAGKGHETYQDIAGVKRHFDDKEEVSNLFALRTKK